MATKEQPKEGQPGKELIVNEKPSQPATLEDALKALSDSREEARRANAESIKSRDMVSQLQKANDYQREQIERLQNEKLPQPESVAASSEEQVAYASGSFTKKDVFLALASGVASSDWAPKSDQEVHGKANHLCGLAEIFHLVASRRLK